MKRQRPIIPAPQVHDAIQALPDAASRREFIAGLSAETLRAYQLWKAKRECENDPALNAALVDRARRRMDRVDNMPPEMRRVVHEYGLEVVHVFIEQGIRDPRKIAFLIDTVRGADLPGGQARFKFNKGPNSMPNPINQRRRES